MNFTSSWTCDDNGFTRKVDIGMGARYLMRVARLTNQGARQQHFMVTRSTTAVQYVRLAVETMSWCI